MSASPVRVDPTRFLQGVNSVRKTVKWRTKLWLKTQRAPEFDDYPETCQLRLDKPLWIPVERHGASQTPESFTDNWDTPWQLQRLSDSELSQSFRDHFQLGVPWESTSYWAELKQSLAAGNMVQGCQTSDDVPVLLHRMDTLFESMTQKRDLTPYLADTTPIQLAIGRHGDLVVVNGEEHVVMGRLAGVNTFPAKIVLRHPKWIRFCKQFRCFLQTEAGGQAYQPVTHVDLQHLPASWSNNRFPIVADCLSHGSGRLMDIGANLGYFCHRAEEMGYDCIAIEACRRLAYFADRLRRADNRQFQVLNDSVLEYPFEDPFDVVLALNIFHHFLKTKKRFESLVTMLGRMKTREMIFQAHRLDEPQMRHAYRDFAPKAFVQFILENSCLNASEEIGVDRGRRIFRLSSSS